jgi:hypothetical protein
VSIIVNEDYKELLSTLNGENAEYIIVGAFAVAAYGHARYTKDFDVWVRPSAENAERVYRALAKFGAPMDRIKAKEFTEPDTVFQIGVEPVRIDIITDISGVDFDAAWETKVAFHYGGVPTWVISREKLLVNKRASGRPHDLSDAQALEKLGPL